MSKVWYIQHGGKTVGPITSQRLKQLASAARIQPDTKLRLGGDGTWHQARKVKGLFRSNAKQSLEPSTSQPAATAESKQDSQASTHGDAASTPMVQATTFVGPYQTPTPVESPNPSMEEAPRGQSGIGIAQALRSIWLSPRRTIGRLIRERPTFEAVVIAMVAFGAKFIDNCLLTNEDSVIDIALIFAPIGVPISALIGVIALYIFGFMHKVVGEAFGGHGDYPSLRVAFAWSLVPSLLSLLISVLLLVVASLVPSILTLPTIVLNLPFTLLLIWGIFIEVGGISAAHGFSFIRAIVTFVVTVIILTLAAMIIALGVAMITF